MNLDYTELGSRLALQRRKLKLRQSHVAELADISDNYLSSIETGRSIPSLEVLTRLCTVLSVTPDAVLLGIDKRRILDADSEFIISCVKQLNEEDRAFIVEFIKWYTESRNK